MTLDGKMIHKAYWEEVYAAVSSLNFISSLYSPSPVQSGCTEATISSFIFRLKRANYYRSLCCMEEISQLQSVHDSNKFLSPEHFVGVTTVSLPGEKGSFFEVGWHPRPDNS